MWFHWGIARKSSGQVGFGKSFLGKADMAKGSQVYQIQSSRNDQQNIGLCAKETREFRILQETVKTVRSNSQHVFPCSLLF